MWGGGKGLECGWRERSRKEPECVGQSKGLVYIRCAGVKSPWSSNPGEHSGIKQIAI